MSADTTTQHKEKILKEATESLAAIIDSASPKHDLSVVIINAIAEGKINHVTVNF